VLLGGGFALLAILLEEGKIAAQDGLGQVDLVLELVEGIVEALGGDRDGVDEALLLATGAAASLVLFDETARGKEDEVEHALQRVEVMGDDIGLDGGRDGGRHGGSDAVMQRRSSAVVPDACRSGVDGQARGAQRTASKKDSDGDWAQAQARPTRHVTLAVPEHGLAMPKQYLEQCCSR
jgi:hypothetical protein